MINEDFKNITTPLDSIVIKWALYLKERLDEGETLIKLIKLFIKTDRQ